MTFDTIMCLLKLKRYLLHMINVICYFFCSNLDVIAAVLPEIRPSELIIFRVRPCRIPSGVNIFKLKSAV